MKNKGFTIIELIVVIAIIAILAAIVLVNVMQYIARSRDAAIKAEADQINVKMLTIFEHYSSYTLKDSSGNDIPERVAIDTMRDKIDEWGGNIVNWGTSLSNSTYRLCAELNGGGSYCVDSTGYKKETANICADRMVELSSEDAPPNGGLLCKD